RHLAHTLVIVAQESEFGIGPKHQFTDQGGIPIPFEIYLVKFQPSKSILIYPLYLGIVPFCDRNFQICVQLVVILIIEQGKRWGKLSGKFKIGSAPRKYASAPGSVSGDSQGIGDGIGFSISKIEQSQVIVLKIVQLISHGMRNGKEIIRPLYPFGQTYRNSGY